MPFFSMRIGVVLPRFDFLAGRPLYLIVKPLNDIAAAEVFPLSGWRPVEDSAEGVKEGLA